MKIINPYYYCWYSYFISPYFFTSPVPEITPFHIEHSPRYKENKRIVFLPFPTVIHINDNYTSKHNVTNSQIQKFIQRIKKHEFPKKIEIPLEDY